MMQDEQKDTVAQVESEVVDREIDLPTNPGETLSREEMFKLLSKKINVEPVQGSLASDFSRAVQGLDDLKKEVVAKRAAILEKKQLIEGKLAFFQQSGMVNVDDAERQKSNQSVDQFIAILDQMMLEIGHDVAFYQSLVSQTPPEHVTVMKNDSDSFADYVAKRVGIIKRYIKAVNRDLNVSFSRYLYGFDTQIKRILYIEQVLKRAQQGGGAKSE